MLAELPSLLRPGELTDDEIKRLLTSVGLADWRKAHHRLLALAADDVSRCSLEKCLPMLLTSLSDAATPDGSLVNFDRFAQCVPDSAKLFEYLAQNPRAVEILIKLFVGSQFLTEILLRNPIYLDRLTQHKRLAEFKSRQEFVEEARQAYSDETNIEDKFDALRRFQRWELLRIGACDSFGLMDLKTVTVQLSLLADSIVQSCLAVSASKLQVSLNGFSVLALGKLGGEELNYSSDIDLVFVADSDAAKYWQLGQRLIKSLISSSAEGFLYRTDMRLRPWGRSGPLVTAINTYVDYLQNHGMLWEKQAMLKARVIAGSTNVGNEFLQRVEPMIFRLPVDRMRDSIREMKERIETELDRQGKRWGEVKSGTGSIRDIEFVTQFLQLAHGGQHPAVRSINTLDGLTRLADFGFLHGSEYRHLTSGYQFFRKIEHSLQLMHHKQTHALPDDSRELAYLARRLDFPNADQFLTYYQRHCSAVRAIYNNYIGNADVPFETVSWSAADQLPEHIARMEPSYSKIFSDEEIDRHAEMLERISENNIVELDAHSVRDGYWQVTLVGFDHRGDLSLICGLLFAYGFNIWSGNVFTDEQVDVRQRDRIRAGTVRSSQSRSAAARKFINVFTLRPLPERMLPDVWTRYRDDLAELLQLVQSGNRREAQGRLAKRVANALCEIRDSATTLYPVDILIDNDSSPRTTALHIRAEDTSGFLYELANALAMARIDIVRVIIASIGNQVVDTLFITDESSNKITDADKQRELRAAVVLIKHFTHLLPRSPNPETALVHFRDFLEQLFLQPHWVDELSSLTRFDVLDALARLLGVSDFLWQDFLRLQHTNLFPVVKDIQALQERKAKEELQAKLRDELNSATGPHDQRTKLNAFKDREMFRADMRHILGQISEFGQFSEELTDVAEIVVAEAYRICDQELRNRYGAPKIGSDFPCSFSICALGKFGGRELGFASDIELMFVYDEIGQTSEEWNISSAEFFLKLIEAFTHAIQAKRAGIFQIDLRLRPYGRAGSPAVSFDAFRQYFKPHGAAWPYERQALVKLRPITGDQRFGDKVCRLRDELIYTAEPFDVAAMRAMREKQVRQLVKAGTVNAKLSPGGLVDCEYLVQGLQITYGHRDQSLRTTNTCQAMTALEQANIISTDAHSHLRKAYMFQRRLIDALRMVRGDAHDLTVPPADGEEFEFLARRLGYRNDLARLQNDLEQHSLRVLELQRLLD